MVAQKRASLPIFARMNHVRCYSEVWWFFFWDGGAVGGEREERKIKMRV